MQCGQLAVPSLTGVSLPLVRRLHCTLKGECSREATSTTNTDMLCRGSKGSHKVMGKPQRETEHGLCVYNRGTLPTKKNMHVCIITTVYTETFAVTVGEDAGNTPKLPC